MQKPIYLDYNATTPLAPEVLDAMLPYLAEHYGNPSSSHVYGQKTARAIADARAQVAELLGCAPEAIIFTSGGTEANNLAIRGVAALRSGERRAITTSVIEHPATAQPCAELQRQGWQLQQVGVDAQCRLNLEQLRTFVTSQTALVTIMHANNETGTLQPIAEVAQIAHAAGALMHTDAAQSIGKVSVRVDELGVDLLSVAGHKLYAPKGVGALYIRQRGQIAPVLRGANHEGGLRPGTENVASIVGLGAACDLCRRHIAELPTRLKVLRDRLWTRLHAAIPDLQINGHPDHRLPNTLSARFVGVRGSALLDAAPQIAASTGSACHEGAERPSGVLVAMGLEPEAALGTVRLSVGQQTTEAMIDQAAEALIRAWGDQQPD